MPAVSHSDANAHLVSNMLNERGLEDSLLSLGGLKERRGELFFPVVDDLGGALIKEAENEREYWSTVLSIAESLDSRNFDTLQQRYNEVQEQVRTRATSGNALDSEVDQLVTDRAKIHSALLDDTKKLVEGYDRLAMAQSTRSLDIKDISDGLESALRNSRIADIPASSAYTKASEADPLKRYEEWRNDVKEHVTPAVEHTNYCLRRLKEAMESEKASLQKNRELLLSGPHFIGDLVAIARSRLREIKAQDPQYDIQHTRTLQVDAHREVNKLQRLANQHRELETLVRENQSSEHEITRHEDLKVSLLHDLELLRVDTSRLQRRNLQGKLDQRLALSSMNEKAEEIERTLRVIDEQLSTYRKLHKESQERIQNLAMTDNPELSLVLQSIIQGKTETPPSRRILEEYVQIEIIDFDPHEVWLSKRNGSNCILKKINVPDSSARNKFDRQIEVARCLKHPYIAEVQNSFYDGNKAYVDYAQSQYGTIVEWARKYHPGDSTLQEVFRQVIQGVDYLHSKGIFMGPRLCNNNIHIGKDGRPRILEAGLSIAGKYQQKKDVPGREEFEGPVPDPVEDMWALGSVFYEVVFGSIPRIDPQRITISLPAHKNESLCALIKHLLTIRAIESEQFFSMSAILSHPFFFQVSSTYMSELNGHENRGRTILKESSWKVERAFCRLHAIREDYQSGGFPLNIDIDRSNIVDSMTKAFLEIRSQDLLRPTVFYIRGIPVHGDVKSRKRLREGNEVREIYAEFFEQLFDPSRRLFDSIAVADGTPREVFVLPSTLHKDNEGTRVYESVGRIMFKMVLDLGYIPERIAPSFLKFLSNTAPTIRDLENYRPDLARACRRLLSIPCTSSSKEALTNVFHPRDLEHVTELNKIDFVSKNINNFLVEDRRPALESLVRGFLTVWELRETVQNLTSTEVNMVLSSNQLVDVVLLRERLFFVGWDPQSTTPRNLLSLLGEMTYHELRRFLIFVSGYSCSVCALGNLEGGITVLRCERTDVLPASNASTWTLDLPDYQDIHVLREKLYLALEIDNEGLA